MFPSSLLCLFILRLIFRVYSNITVYPIMLSPVLNSNKKNLNSSVILLAFDIIINKSDN